MSSLKTEDYKIEKNYVFNCVNSSITCNNCPFEEENKFEGGCSEVYHYAFKQYLLENKIDVLNYEVYSQFLKSNFVAKTEEERLIELFGKFHDEYNVYLTDCSVYGREQMSVDEFYKKEFKSKYLPNGVV